MKLEGKSAVVTGGGRGLGKAFALTLAREGANIAIYDVNIENAEKVAEQIRKLGRRVLAIKCDVSIRAEVSNATKKVLNEFGKIDILVNNAGISPFASAIETKDEVWDRAFNINIRGTFHCNQIIGSSMIERKIPGKIVNLASVAAHVGAPGMLAYSASKGAIVSFTRVLGVEWAKYNIQVNSISPSVTMTEDVLDHFDLIKDRVTRVPMQRFGQPEEIANVVLFLVSADASYITAQDIRIDGGTTALNPAYIEPKPK